MSSPLCTFIEFVGATKCKRAMSRMFCTLWVISKKKKYEENQSFENLCNSSRNFGLAYPNI